VIKENAVLYQKGIDLSSHSNTLISDYHLAICNKVKINVDYNKDNEIFLQRVNAYKQKIRDIVKEQYQEKHEK